MIYVEYIILYYCMKFYTRISAYHIVRYYNIHYINIYLHHINTNKYNIIYKYIYEYMNIIYTLQYIICHMPLVKSSLNAVIVKIYTRRRQILC